MQDDQLDGPPAEATVTRNHYMASAEQDPPKDRYMMAYIIFVLMGTGVLFPWNAFVSALDYWDAYYPSMHAAYTIPFVFMIPNFVFSVVAAVWGNAIHVSTRVYVMFTVYTFSMQTVSVLILARAEHHQGTSQAIIYALSAMLGAVCATANTAVLSVCAQFPPVYMQGVMSGQGMSGIAIITLRAVTKASFEGTGGLRLASLVYFEVATFVMVCCLIAYYVLSTLPITRYYTRGHLSPTKGLQRFVARTFSGRVLTFDDDLPNKLEDRLLDGDADAAPKEAQWRSAVAAIRQIYDLGMGVLVVYSATFTVFPGLMSSFPSTWDIGSWYVVIVMAMFMLGDQAGRMVSKYVILFSQRVTLFLVALRVVLVWFFLIHKTVPSWHIDTGVVMAVIFFAALTNGYFTSVLMMFAPGRVHQDLRPMAGTVMGLFLATGILLGSVIAFVLDHTIN
jgi:equilibrative nucleoside transporter 1/2/3